MKWIEHIKQFPELERRWNCIPDAVKTLFAFVGEGDRRAWVPIGGDNRKPSNGQLIEVTWDTLSGSVAPGRPLKGQFTKSDFVERETFILTEGTFSGKPGNLATDVSQLFSVFKFWRPAQ